MSEPGDDDLVVQDVVWTNLLLLGISPARLEAKHRIPINRTMFKAANKKGMEIVLHFLFVCLDPADAKDQFKFCWPVMERKQETQFRQNAGAWLLQLAEQHPDAGITKLAPSVLMSPGGHKFLNLLLRFSTFVLTNRLTNDYGNHARVPNVPRPPAGASKAQLDVALTAVKAHTRRLCDRFIDGSRRTVAVQRQWRQFASSVTKEYRRVSKGIREAQQQLVALGYSEAPTAADGPKLDEPSLLAKLQVTRRRWHHLQQFTDQTAANREALDAAIDKRANNVRLDASDVPLAVPDLILPAREAAFQAGTIEDVYEAGKLNLHRFVQTWNLGLDIMDQRLRSTDHALRLEPCLPTVATLYHQHQVGASDSDALATSISTVLLPSLQAEIEQLERLVDATDQDTDVGTTLSLQPPTPSTKYAAPDAVVAGGGSDDGKTPLPHRHAGTPAATRFPGLLGHLRPLSLASTPSDAEAMARSVNRAVRNQPPVAAGSGSVKPQGAGKEAPAVAPQSAPAHARSPQGGTSSLRASRATSGGHGSALRPQQQAVAPSPQPRLGDHLALTPGLDTRTVQPATSAAPPATTNPSFPMHISPSTQRHQDLLAQEIVAGVTQNLRDLGGDTRLSLSFERRLEQTYAEQDPIGALQGDLAFTSRDKLARTPVKAQRAPIRGVHDAPDVVVTGSAASTPRRHGTARASDLVFTPAPKTTTPAVAGGRDGGASMLADVSFGLDSFPDSLDDVGFAASAHTSPPRNSEISFGGADGDGNDDGDGDNGAGRGVGGNGNSSLGSLFEAAGDFFTDGVDEEVTGSGLSLLSGSSLVSSRRSSRSFSKGYASPSKTPAPGGHGLIASSGREPHESGASYQEEEEVGGRVPRDLASMKQALARLKARQESQR
eukprot:m.201847 g.201847  ORF g.201847 m.201847 type:complete len:890 (+) comp18430_c0_seq3:189-2858(+)